MVHAVTIFAVVAAPAIGVAVLVYVLVRSLFNYRRSQSGRVYIAIKGVASFAAWLLASCGWLYMFFVMAYWSGPFVDVEGETGEAVSLLILDLLYAVIGSGLALWVRHQPEQIVATSRL